MDNFYVFGFLDQTNIVHVLGRKVSSEPAAKQIVARISMTVQEVLGEPKRNATITKTVVANVKDTKVASTLCRLLESRADGIYQIDYTQDYSEVLDRKELVENLLENGFGMQNSSNYPEKGCILNNTTSVGGQVCP